MIISCNNNGTNASTAAVLCVYLLRQNEGEKHIKVFLEQSTVGPFADVMRRNVALMGLHYTDARFSFVEHLSQDAFTVNPLSVHSHFSAHSAILTLATHDEIVLSRQQLL